MKYNIGDKLLCIKDFCMNFSQKEIAFVKGRIYTIFSVENDGFRCPYRLKSEISSNHGMDDEVLDQYFVKDRELKLRRILDDKI